MPWEVVHIHGLISAEGSPRGYMLHVILHMKNGATEFSTVRSSHSGQGAEPGRTPKQCRADPPGAALFLPSGAHKGRAHTQLSWAQNPNRVESLGTHPCPAWRKPSGASPHPKHRGGQHDSSKKSRSQGCPDTSPELRVLGPRCGLQTCSHQMGGFDGDTRGLSTPRHSLKEPLFLNLPDGGAGLLLAGPPWGELTEGTPGNAGDGGGPAP